MNAPTDHQPCREPIRTHDPISRPAHYCDGRTHEPLDVILDWQLSFCLGSVLKYVSRAGRKGDAVEDLLKARVYLNREIDRLTEAKP